MLYQKSEFLELKDIVNSISDFIPEKYAGYVWNHYKKIAGNNENQPCMCGSSAKHWKKAVTVLRDYIQNNSQFYLS